MEDGDENDGSGASEKSSEGNKSSGSVLEQREEKTRITRATKEVIQAIFLRVLKSGSIV